MKIEPMSAEEIKNLIIANGAGVVPIAMTVPGTVAHDIERLALTWIHAEAQAREAEHIIEEHGGIAAQNCRHVDWIAAVKREVGWPEGE